MAASGACGLVWQIIWTAGFGVVLGHELVAVLAVLGAFFAGLALGSFLLGGRIERSRRPGLWYALLEAGIGLWGLGVALALPSLAAPLAHWLGPQPSPWLHTATGLLVPLIVLLPATAAMGATLPALERQVRSGSAQALPVLYAGNTGGALLGLLVAVFFALPTLGVRSTAFLCAGLNLVCAAVAWGAWRSPIAASAARIPPPTRDRLTSTLFATGLLGIGFEVLAVRVLSQVCENTVYTYAMLLSCFLLGTAGGAALLRAAAPMPADWEAWTDRLLLLLVCAVLAGGCSLWWADTLQALPSVWGVSAFSAELLGEALAGAAAMLPASVAMGALFSLLCLRASDRGWPLGRAVGWNTLGCAAAPALVGALLAPWLGAHITLALLALGYLLLLSSRSWQKPTAGIAVAAICALAAFGPPLRFIDVPAGGRLLSHREGPMAAVSVVADAGDVARLHINNRVQEGSSASGLVETRLAQLPLLLHAAPHRALFLGLGTGYTAHAAALDPAVQVRAVELLPEVIDASSMFMLRPGAPRAARPVDLVAADARRFVQADESRYDVVVADLFHPARSGAGSLYTVEHFRAVRQRLAPDGLFCQWLALHQMDLPTLRSIAAAFIEVYPQGVAVLAGNSLDTPVIGLLARPDRPTWRLDEVQARLAAPPPALAAALQVARIDSAYAVLGSVLADSAALRQFAQGTQANTDDLPVVAHRAARVDYAPEAQPRERLQALLHLLPAEPAGALVAHEPAAAGLQGYWRARQQYLLLGLQWQPDADAGALLQRTGPALLEMVTRSPHFKPAADALTALAQATQDTDYPLAQQVLGQLRRAQGGPMSLSTPTPSPLTNEARP